MIDADEKVTCPLMDDKEIKIYTCFEIHCVLEGSDPKSIAPPKAFVKKD